MDFTSKDDASVYKLGDNYIFETLDFFTPNVEDPYIFGQIVAANSLSDIYAMGATPITCQSIVAFPQNNDLNILKTIMKGACDKLNEAGVSLTGGHSIYDHNVKFGLSVTGTGKNIWKNNGVQNDDVLILTKKLGTGIIVAAGNVYDIEDEVLNECYNSMTELNKYSKEIIENYQINACTDITGFGLLGHLHEMIDNTDYSASINTKDIKILNSALGFAKQHVYTSSGTKNRKFLNNKVQFNNVDSALQEILFDAQTSGGLLFSTTKADAAKIIEELKTHNCSASIIGYIFENKQNIIEVS